MHAVRSLALCLAPLLTLIPAARPQAGGATPEPTRQELEKEARAAAVAKLEKGWKSFEIAPFLVLSEGQDAIARETATDAAILWKWMGETFDTFAPDAYAPAPILSFHASEGGARQHGYVEGGYVFAGDGPYRLATYPALFLQSNVRRRVGEAWFEAKDRDLYFALPGWMRAGLVENFADARTKGGKMIFKPDTNTLFDFARAMREDKLLPLRKFLKTPLPRDASKGEGKDQRFSPSPQAGQFVRYLLIGKGAKGPKTKKILSDTIAAVAPMVPELAKEVDAALEKDGVQRTDPKWVERRALEFEKLESRVLDAVFDKVFAGWTDKDWEALADGYKFDKF